jgi:hypothetical protein
MAREVITLSVSLSPQERALLDRITEIWNPGRSRRVSDTVGRLIREKAIELKIYEQREQKREDA